MEGRVKHISWVTYIEEQGAVLKAEDSEQCGTVEHGGWCFVGQVREEVKLNWLLRRRKKPVLLPTAVSSFLLIQSQVDEMQLRRTVSIELFLLY